MAFLSRSRFDMALIVSPTPPQRRSAIRADSRADLPTHHALVLECGQWPEAEDPLSPYPRALFSALAAVAWRRAEHPSPILVPAGRSAEVRAALDFTEERLGEEVRLEEVADAVALAPRSLARRFESELDMTWRAVLRRMRVLRAVELLATDTPVTTIAHEVGYGSLSAFNAAFRDLTNATPSQYRATFTRWVDPTAGPLARVSRRCPTPPPVDLFARVVEQWHACGMSRTRLSTTVDADLLASARKASGTPDAALVDEALAALLARHCAAEVDASYVAYDACPLDEPDA